MWGEAGVMIYNTATRNRRATSHPASLGANVRDAWPEVRDFNDHVIKVVPGGQAPCIQDQELTLHRNGQADEQMWMNLDYSPIIGEQPCRSA
jgi:hypothetical protein